MRDSNAESPVELDVAAGGFLGERAAVDEFLGLAQARRDHPFAAREPARCGRSGVWAGARRQPSRHKVAVMGIRLRKRDEERAPRRRAEPVVAAGV